MSAWTKDERQIAKFAREFGTDANPQTWSTVQDWATDLKWPMPRTRQALRRLFQRGRLMRFDPGDRLPPRFAYKEGR